jgi:RNA polymerase sigma-70 factor (ECF subfamily)
MMTNEVQLIGEAARGSGAAFGELVHRHRDRLLRAILPVVGCWAEADDVVQEAMVRAHVSLKTFQHRSTFYTWLYRIALNRAASRRRVRHLHLSIDDRNERIGVEPVAASVTPLDQMVGEERNGHIRRALAAVSEMHREILVLRDVYDYDYQAIATTLKISIGTVRSRLHRARIQLRDELRRRMPEYLPEYIAQ